MIHPEITDLQFRAMARERGYELRTRKKPIYILPCPKCGKKRTSIWFTIGKETTAMYRRCRCCGFEGDYAKTKTESYRTWNDAVKRYLVEDEVFGHDE